MYSDIASAAESGMDFSSRWFAWDGPRANTMSSIRTSKIVPVDLNAILYWNAQLLSMFAKLIGQYHNPVLQTPLLF